jgi:hypothetical protein
MLRKRARVRRSWIRCGIDLLRHRRRGDGRGQLLRRDREGRRGRVRRELLRMSTVMGPAIAGPILDPGAAQRMLETVHELAVDRYAGRRVGTPSGRAAAQWLTRQLEALGSTVTLDEFPVDGAVRELYQTPTLSWNDGTRDTSLVHRRDFAEHLASADIPTPIFGPLALPGAGDLQGAWLLDVVFSRERVAEAVAEGAVGVMLPRGTDEAGWMPKMIAGPAATELPVLSIRNDLHQQMSLAVLRGGASATGSVGLRTVDVTATNVYATVLPAAPGASIVLLTAHYDGVGDDPDQRLPAAADNASGVAVVLEVARQVKTGDLPIGLGVAFLDAEEAGAHGSAHHAPQLPTGTLVINLDGAAALHEAAAVEAGGPAHRLLGALDRAARTTGMPLRAQAMPSDNRRYAAAGHAAIGIGMGMPGYQTPAETPDRVRSTTLVDACHLLLATIDHLAT